MATNYAWGENMDADFKRLKEAYDSKDNDKLFQYFREGAWFDTCDQNGMTILHFAAQDGREDVVNFHIKYSESLFYSLGCYLYSFYGKVNLPDLYAKDVDGMQPWLHAMQNGHFYILNELQPEAVYCGNLSNAAVCNPVCNPNSIAFKLSFSASSAVLILGAERALAYGNNFKFFVAKVVDGVECERKYIIDERSIDMIRDEVTDLAEYCIHKKESPPVEIHGEMYDAYANIVEILVNDKEYGELFEFIYGDKADEIIGTEVYI